MNFPTVFSSLGIIYRTNHDASRVERYDGPLTGWTITTTPRILEEARKALSGESEYEPF
jgi:hypothetical protein